MGTRKRRPAELDHDLAGVSAQQYRKTLLAAAEVAPQVVVPDLLGAAVVLWLRAEEERARPWLSLLGHSGVAVWNAANAVLDAHTELAAWDAVGGGQ